MEDGDGDDIFKQLEGGGGGGGGGSSNFSEVVEESKYHTYRR